MELFITIILFLDLTLLYLKQVLKTIKNKEHTRLMIYGGAAPLMGIVIAVISNIIAKTILKLPSGF